MALLLICACTKDVTVHQFSGPTMGTQYRVKWVGSNQSKKPLKSQVDKLLVDVNLQMSTYIRGSEISRFNQSKAGDWFPVSPAFARVAFVAREISWLTNRSFDPTIGSVVNLWGFGPEERPTHSPSKNQVDAALKLVGNSRWVAQVSPARLMKKLDSLNIDLSAIAKGYAVDAVGKLLETHGITNYFVEIGGEILAKGSKGNIPWQIAIESPVAGNREIFKAVKIKDIAIATSGDYRNYFEENGVRYSHTIDPKTGFPIKHRLAAVSVLHDSCMYADAYATALLVMGPTKGYQWSVEHEIAALFIVKTSSGEFKNIQTPNFNKRLGFSSSPQ